MAYGGRAYDDGKPWWKEDNNTSSETQPMDTNNRYGSHGVHNGSAFGSAYDDATASDPSYHPPTSFTTSLHSTASSDPYESIRSKSKMQSNRFGPRCSDSTNPFSLRQSPPSNGSNSVHNAVPKSSHRSKPSMISSNLSNFGNAVSSNNGPTPLSRTKRSSQKHKSRSSHYRDDQQSNLKEKRAPRTRPHFDDAQQRMEYKQRVRESTKSKLDQSLQTAYQSEEVAADSAERLYHQRSLAIFCKVIPFKSSFAANKMLKF